jgi:tRNA (adenine57-N1/adenine58-N1)-methyltransferase catalytic subunit
MGVIVYKPTRRVMVDGVERVISKHEQWYVRDTSRDFHGGGMIIKKEQLKPGKVKVGNNEFFIIESSFLDEYKGIKRDAQIITRKDLGFIIGFCGLTKDSVIVESGVGSGAATVLFAKLCKKVYSYEIEQSNIDVAKENLARLKIKNAVVAKGDFYNAKIVKVKNADFVLLDLPEPWKALETAKKCVKLGGYIVAYTPSITQAAKFTNTLPEGMLHERTTEIIDRDWKIKGDAVRPMTADIGHTAFLTIVRRIL